MPSLQQLLEAGVHFGHQVRRGNPRMRPYIYGARDGVHIIDLTLSAKLLQEAYDFVFDLGKKGGVLLFVGTKKQARSIVEELAKKVGAPYMTSRWIGGFITNFDEILRNIKKLKELKDQKEKGQLNKYTKKERLLISRKIAKLERDLSGVADLVSIPDAIFVVDTVTENIAVSEASKRDVKIVGITDTNSNPTLVDYPIPGNDDAIKSIRIITETIAKAYEDGKKQGGKDAEKALKKAEKEAKKAEEVITAETVAEEVAQAEEEIEKEALEESGRKV